ncbi:MAG: Bug family tripartite tricarboxylate transporter substrate binding protein [Burkholderiales bacterium]
MNFCLKQPNTVQPAITLAIAFTLCASSAFAQLSGKPVQMISGYPPGGNVDVLARLFGEKLGEALGRPVVVVNRAGAGGQIGLEAVKAAAPDGNTLIVTPDSSLVLRPLTMKDPPYHPLKDFAAVAHAGAQDYVFAVGGNIPAKDLREFATWAKANPTQANFGAGQGGSTHLIGIMIGDAIGVPLQAIPYNGSGPAVTALLAGQIAATVQPLGTVIAQAQAGKIRFIATTGIKRAPESPNTPTMGELGHAALTVSSWFGIFAPAGTPTEIVSQLNSIFQKAARTESMKERLHKLGLDVREMNPTQLTSLVKADYERWAPVIKSSGFTMQ